jgi:hypothetical protein
LKEGAALSESLQVSAKAVEAGRRWVRIDRMIGNAAETIVGNILNLAKNGRSITNTISGTDRIPDFWNNTEKIIAEVKNVSEQSFTAQLQDMAMWAYNNGFTFQLWVDKNTKISDELQQAINNGWIQLERFSWP